MNGPGPGLPAVVLEPARIEALVSPVDGRRVELVAGSRHEIKLFIILRDAVLRNRYDSMVSTIAITAYR